jgi:hypothetical protein
VTDDDIPTLTVLEEIPVGDRKYAWTAVILSMALALLAATVTVIGGALWLREREALNDQVIVLNDQIDVLLNNLSCRAEAEANLDQARAQAEVAHVALVLEITEQLINELDPNKTPDLRSLAASGEAARGAAATAAIEVIKYQRAIVRCEEG